MRMLLATVAVAAGLILTGGAQAQTVGIATSNPGSLFHSIGSAVARAANDSGLLNATIQPATSPNQYMPLVNANEVEFGVGNLEEFTYALDGEAWFEGSVNDDLRVVGLIMPIREAIFVRADSDIESIADLEGEPMVDGYTAQQTILPQLDAHYAAFGLTRDDMQPVQVPSVVAGADAFMAGESTGFIFAHGAGKVREADAAVGGLRALGVPDTEEALEAIREHWRTGYIVTIEPGPAAPGVEEPATYIAYPQVVFTNASVDDETVRAMAQVLHENQEVMAEAFPPFNLFDPQEMVADIAPAEYHSGAIDFYQEVGLWNE